MLKNSEAQMIAQVVGWDSKLMGQVKVLLTISRLAKKHHHLAEYACNGEGWVRGQRYTLGKPENGSLSGYKWDRKSPFLDADTSIFDVESGKAEDAITALVRQLGSEWSVEYQGDPRGNTVKVSYQGRWINLNV